MISYLQVRWAFEDWYEDELWDARRRWWLRLFFIIVFLQFYGKRLRAWSGKLNFKTN